MTDKNKYKILSGSVLKTIALITMLIDHYAAIILDNLFEFKRTLFVFLGTKYSVYFILRMVGRIAFPIYVFLLVEGYLYTHDRKKYGLNILIFALISEIPWNLAHKGEFFYSEQNVFFTLFLGFLAMYFYDEFQENPKKQFISLIILFFAAAVFGADYGTVGLGFIIFMYIFRENNTRNNILKPIIGSCFLPYSVMIMISFLPIMMYNGKRGFIKGKFLKYLYYIIYPLHFFILYLIKYKKI